MSFYKAFFVSIAVYFVQIVIYRLIGLEDSGIIPIVSVMSGLAAAGVLK